MQNGRECPISWVVCMWARCHSPINVDWVQVLVCPSKCFRADSIASRPPKLFHARNKTHELQYTVHRMLDLGYCTVLYVSCFVLKQWMIDPVVLRSCVSLQCEPGCANFIKKKINPALYFCFIVLKVNISLIKTHLFEQVCDQNFLKWSNVKRFC